MSNLLVVYKNVDDLIPYPNNAKLHPKHQIEQLVASYFEFGFINPILEDANGVIVAGHGRLMAAKKAGLKQVPVIQLGHLSEAQARALRLADNKLALTGGGWDDDLLNLELRLVIETAEVDVSMTGFSPGEVNKRLAPPAEPDDDIIPPVPSKPRTKTGDIWELGEHRVGCGDGRDPKFVAAVVGNRVVDCAYVDPPYNVRINGHANLKRQHREFMMASGEMSPEKFEEFLAESLAACVRVSREGAVHFICMDWRHADTLFRVGAALYGEQLNLCFWNKSNAGMGSLYRSKHELVFVYRVGNAPHLNTIELGRHGRSRTNVWDYPSVNSFKGSRRQDLALHPTVKPIAMVADAIQDVTRHGDLVLDTFLGSGTTLLACERTGRRFRGLDLDPAYVDLAIDRWATVTNREPVLVHSTQRTDIGQGA